MRTVWLGGLMGLALLAGCSSSSDGDKGKDPGLQEEKPVTVAQAKSSLTRNTSPAVADADKATLATDNQAFALNAYGAIAKTPGNVFFSPYSISAAIAMTYAGAKGNTATEMATALHFSLPQERLHPAFDAVDLAVTAAPPASASADATPFVLRVANSLWGYTKEPFNQPFLDTLATNYGAGMNLEDFVADPHGSEDQINDWVSQNTNGKIDHLLNGNITDLTRLVLVNAIYFDADWAQPFSKEATQPGTFTTDSGAIQTDLMHAQYSMRSMQTDAYDAVEIPYDGTAVMDIVLPKAGTLGAFESTLTGDSLQKIVSGLDDQLVNLTLPKFGYQGGTIKLAPMLKGLGMNLAFTADADFTGMANDRLHIDDVVHKAFLKVDEKGTEAAAATAVIVGGANAIAEPPPKVIDITVDHPFFFTIRETGTNTILFAGRVTDPTK